MLLLRGGIGENRDEAVKYFRMVMEGDHRGGYYMLGVSILNSGLKKESNDLNFNEAVNYLNIEGSSYTLSIVLRRKRCC